MTRVNRRITLAARPVGFPRISDFQISYRSLPEPEAGEVLLRTLYLSLDPRTRETMDATSDQVVALDSVVPGAAVAVVVRSLDSDLRPGDLVEGMLGWQEYAAASARDLRRLDPGLSPISAALGVLGAPGLTAHFALLELCDPQPGETVAVSAAAGAVGVLAGQIAKVRGCRVVGITESAETSRWLLEDLAFDAGLSSLDSADLDRALGEACPAGIDVYVDNVGGTLSDAVMERINPRSRIAICGQLSQLNLEAPELGPRHFGRLMAKQSTVRGFLLAGFTERFAEGRRQLTGWLAQGRLKIFEDVAIGIESAPRAFIYMLHGRDQGQPLVQLFEM